MPRFLVIRFSSIGDILMTTPAVRALKQQVPGAQVYFATKEAYRPLLESNPYLDGILTLDGSLLGLAWKAWRLGITHVVDLHSNVRSRLLSALLLHKTYRVEKGTAERETYIADKSKRPAPLHMVDRHLAALVPLGVKPDGGGLDYRPAEADHMGHERFSIIGSVPYAAFCIGGQHATKRLPEAKVVEFLRYIDRPVILLGGKEEAEEGSRIAGTLALEGRWDVFNGCGALTLGQSGSVLAQAEEVYSHDTGLMHMAAALGKPVHSIWGSTVPAFGMYPYGTDFAVYKVEGLPCQPCHRHGADVCPEGHFKCMWEQTPLPRPLEYNTKKPGTRQAMIGIALEVRLRWRSSRRNRKCGWRWGSQIESPCR